MNAITSMSDIARSEGDPKVIETGPSSLGMADRMGRMLGWFSLGLGLTELVAPGAITRAIGLEGKEGLVRAYGVREIGAGVLSLSTEQSLGLWSRVAGDGLDMATVAPALSRDNPKRQTAMLAMTMLAGVALIDLVAAKAVTARHSRTNGTRSYRDRSGFPQGVEAARGAASELRARDDLRTAPRLPAAPSSDLDTAAASSPT